MKTAVLASLFAFGLALATPASALAAPINGSGGAGQFAPLVEPVYYACRNVRVCNWYHGRHYCHWRRVCRHWY